jgi:hypothetical protein
MHSVPGHDSAVATCPDEASTTRCLLFPSQSWEEGEFLSRSDSLGVVSWEVGMDFQNTPLPLPLLIHMLAKYLRRPLMFLWLFAAQLGAEEGDAGR